MKGFWQSKHGIGGYMKNVDIMEAIVSTIEEKIINEWRHEGMICAWSGEYIDFEVDGQEYMLRIASISNELKNESF